MSGLYWSPDTICFDPQDEARRCELIRLGGNVDHHFKPAMPGRCKRGGTASYPAWLSSDLASILVKLDAGTPESYVSEYLRALGSLNERELCARGAVL